MIEWNWFWVALFPSHFIPAWQICRKALTQAQERELGQVGGPCSRPCGPDLATRKPKMNSQHHWVPVFKRRSLKGKGMTGTVIEGNVGTRFSLTNWSLSILSLSLVLGAMAEDVLCTGPLHGSSLLCCHLPSVSHHPTFSLWPPVLGSTNPLATSCFSQVRSAWWKWILESSHKYFGQDMKRQWPLARMSRRALETAACTG